MPDRLITVPGDEVDAVALFEPGEAQDRAHPLDLVPRQRPDLPHSRILTARSATRNRRPLGWWDGTRRSGGRPMSSPLAITRFVPTEDQFAWTFGGCEPIMRIRPGDVLDLFTEDAFGGRIRSTEDVPSQTITYPYINPQTGPVLRGGSGARGHVGDPPDRRPAGTRLGRLDHRSAVRRIDRHEVHGHPPARPPRADVGLRRRPAGRRGHLPGARLRLFGAPAPRALPRARSASRRRPTRLGTCSCPRRSAATWTRPKRVPGRRSTSA